MQGLGLIPEDISNMMMGPPNEDMMKMMAEMSGMGLDQSGSQNPFDLLQAQQMQQFQEQMMMNFQNQNQNPDNKQPPK